MFPSALGDDWQPSIYSNSVAKWLNSQALATQWAIKVPRDWWLSLAQPEGHTALTVCDGTLRKWEMVASRMFISDITSRTWAGPRRGKHTQLSWPQPPLISPVLCPLSEASSATLSLCIPVSLHSVWPRDNWLFTIAELTLKDSISCFIIQCVGQRTCLPCWRTEKRFTLCSCHSEGKPLLPPELPSSVTHGSRPALESGGRRGGLLVCNVSKSLPRNLNLCFQFLEVQVF